MSLYKRLHEQQGNGSGPITKHRDPVLDELRQKIHHHLIDELGPILYDKRLSEDDLRRRVQDQLHAALAVERSPLSAADKAQLIQLIQDVSDDILGLESIIERTGGAIFPASGEEGTASAFAAADRIMRTQFVTTYASSVEQGSVDISVSMGATETAASYVAGDQAQGAATTPLVPSSSALGPAWLRTTTVMMVALALLGLAGGAPTPGPTWWARTTPGSRRCCAPTTRTSGPWSTTTPPSPGPRCRLGPLRSPGTSPNVRTCW